MAAATRGIGETAMFACGFFMAGSSVWSAELLSDSLGSGRSNVLNAPESFWNEARIRAIQGGVFEA